MRGRLADGSLKTAQLAEMMAHVNGMKAAPLLRGERAEYEMGCDPRGAEALVALVEQGVHLIDVLTEKLDHFRAVHRGPMQLVGAHEGRSGCAARKVSEGKHHELEHPLHNGAAIVSGAAALEALMQHAAAAAAGEDEVLEEFLSRPEAIVLKRMHLAPLRCGAGELAVVGVEELLQNGMHG